MRRLLFVTCMLVASFQTTSGMIGKKEFRPKIDAYSLGELVSGVAQWRRINSLTTDDETKIKKRSLLAAGSNLISAAAYLYVYFKRQHPDFEGTEKTVWFPVASIIKHLAEGTVACQTYRNAKKIAGFNGETNLLDENYKIHLSLLLASRTALLGSTYTACNTTKLIAQVLSPFWTAYEHYLSVLNDKESQEKR